MVRPAGLGRGGRGPRGLRYAVGKRKEGSWAGPCASGLPLAGKREKEVGPAWAVSPRGV
jgi:hypothetical protein